MLSVVPPKPAVSLVSTQPCACLPAGASPRRSAAVSFLPAGAEEEQDGR